MIFGTQATGGVVTERMRLTSIGIAQFEETMKIKERADSLGDTATYGQLWVKNTDPNELWFTDGDGTSTKIV